MPPLECCLQVPIALSGPRFGVVKRGEVVQKRPEALRVCFPSVIVAPSRTPACRYLQKMTKLSDTPVCRRPRLGVDTS